MTDKTQALRDLLAKVEAGTIFAGDFVTDEEAALVYDAFPPNDDDVVGSAEWAGLAYDGSLDAAKALHDVVLPGWAVDHIGIWPGGTSSALIVGTHIEHDGDRWHNHKDGEADGVADTAARAWLIAIIRALIAQADQ